MITPANFIIITSLIFIVLLYWFKLRMMKRRIGLSILGLIIFAYPAFGFFSFLHFLMQYYFHYEGKVQWRVDPSRDLIGFMVRGGWSGYYVSLSHFVISAILTPIFFICLALLLKEWKNRKDENACAQTKFVP